MDTNHWLYKNPEIFIGGNHWLENLITLTIEVYNSKIIIQMKSIFIVLKTCKELNSQILKDGGMRKKRGLSYFNS